jgi:Cd(II)/Pb(II)-responsive transcriptional regulator
VEDVRIGELANRAGTNKETVRHYENLGLLPQPERTPGNYRAYAESDLERLRFIRNCREIGMTLEEVRRLLYFRNRPDLACYEINELLDKHIARVNRQLRDLTDLAASLRALRACCDDPRTAGDCGILAQLERGGG